VSELRPRLDAMRASKPGKTRTADPRPPDQFPMGGNYRSYILFGSCGIFLLLTSLLLLRVVGALGAGEEAWNALMASFQNPLYIGYHVIAFVALVWFTLRFFRLFPKTQPPTLGPAPRPPDAFFLVALNAAFVAVTAGLSLLLWGVIG